MGWFSGRQNEGPMTPEAVALRQSIAEHRSLDVPGAKRWVDDYVDAVMQASGVGEVHGARSWIEDRMRVHLCLTIGPYFDLLHRQAPLVATGLQAEYNSMMDDPAAFPTAHIIAWWWSLHPEKYRSNLDEFFAYRRQMTANTVREIADNGGDYESKMFDWHD